MNKDKLLGITIGLMIAISVVYLIETFEEFEEQDTLKATFFLAVTIGYIISAIMLFVSKSKKIAYLITIIGSIILFILYFATRETIEDIGELGIISKTIQIGIITGIIMLIKKQS